MLKLEDLRKFSLNKWVVDVVSMIVILVFYLPYFLHGEYAPVLIHDNLDSNLAWAKVLLNNEAFWTLGSFQIDQVMSGIPRSSIQPSFDFNLVFFKLFGPYYGYVICRIFMSVCAYFGMKLLLNRYLLSSKSVFISSSSAILFAILPFWSFTLSVAGLPLIIYTFLKLLSNEGRKLHFAILILFPFFSSLILIGMYLIPILLLFFLIDYLKKKEINWQFVIGFGLFFFCYFLSHLPLIETFLFGDMISSRQEMKVYFFDDFQTIKSFDLILRFGQYHAHSLHTYLILPILLALVVRVFMGGWKIYSSLIVFIVFTSIIYAILYYGSIGELYAEYMKVFPFQLQRFHLFHPMIWYVLLAMSLETFSRVRFLGLLVVVGVILFQAVYIVGLSKPATSTRYNKPSSLEYIANLAYDISEYTRKNYTVVGKDDGHFEKAFKQNNAALLNSYYEKSAPLFGEFYDSKIFEEIHQQIGLPKSSYNTISLGIHPSIAQFNGFNTLDAYVTSYDLSYKHNFRKIIEPELNKNSFLKNYFDFFGARCYAFVHELKFSFIKQYPAEISEPDFNYQLLKEMNCKYIFSSAEIVDSTLTNLIPRGSYHNDDSFYRIHLYEVK